MTAIIISPNIFNQSIYSSVNSDLSISYSCSFICLKRTPRFFVVWHGKSSVEIILSELIIPFFDRFSRTKSVNKNTQNSEMNSACFCLHSQSTDLDGFSKHPYENLPNASALMELMMRLELMTSSLPRMCATTCATSASCPLGQLCYDTTFGGILQAFF